MRWGFQEVVIHHQVAELQVDALGSRLRSDHDSGLITEILHEGGPHVGTRRARDAIRAGMLLQPAAVDVSIVGRYSCR